MHRQGAGAALLTGLARSATLAAITFARCRPLGGGLVVHAHGQGNALAGYIHLHHLHLDDIPGFYHIPGVLDEGIRQRGNMHQTVLMHTDVDEGAEIGDVGDRAFKHHARLEVLDASTPSWKLAKRNSGRGSRPGFSSSARISLMVGRPNCSVTYFCGSRLRRKALSPINERTDRPVSVAIASTTE